MEGFLKRLPMPGTQQDSSSGSPEAASITDPVSVWNDAELSSLKADYRFADGASQVVSKYNPTPGKISRVMRFLSKRHSKTACHEFVQLHNSRLYIRVLGLR